MVRHLDFRIDRPISESELIEKIEAGLVSGQDEISASTSYWFTLHEVEAVKHFFGDQILLKALLPSNEEITSSTNTAILTTPIQVSHAFNKMRPVTVKEAPSEPHPSQLAFSLMMVAIFLGTLCLLWWGSK